MGGYVLGEFGHLIVEREGNGSQDQFELLHSKFPTSTDATKAMLLTTYAKFVNLYPELTDLIHPVFEEYGSSMDAELQQRACEYVSLVDANDEELLVRRDCELYGGKKAPNLIYYCYYYYL